MTRKLLSTLDMGLQKIVNMLDPTLAQDASTKNYVDNNGTGGLRTRAAIDAALLVGGVIRVANDVTIALSTPLVIGVDGTKFFGGKFTVTSGVGIEVTASRVEVAGATISGGGQGSTYDSTQNLIYILGTKAAPLTQINIHDCDLDNSRSGNIWMEWCTRSKIHHNTCRTYLMSGIMLISCDQVKITANDIADAIIAVGQVECYGIAITDLTNLATDRSKHVTVTGNNVQLIDWEGIDTHGGDSIVVTGNTVLGCPRGIALVVGAAGRNTAPINCVVTGNTVDSSGLRVTLREGIWLAGVSGIPASGVITGNVILNYTTPFGGFTFYDRTTTLVGNNSVPFIDWTNIPVIGTWTRTASFPGQYMMDNGVVYFQGGLIPGTGGTSGNPGVATMPATTWPSARTFYAVAHGSNTAAGFGTWNIDATGNLRLENGSTTDSFTYWCSGSYRAGN